MIRTWKENQKYSHVASCGVAHFKEAMEFAEWHWHVNEIERVLQKRQKGNV